MSFHTKEKSLEKVVWITSVFIHSAESWFKNLINEDKTFDGLQISYVYWRNSSVNDICKGSGECLDGLELKKTSRAVQKLENANKSGLIVTLVMAARVSRVAHMQAHAVV